VAIHYKTPQQIDLDELCVSQARSYLEQGHFPAGSMGPKIEACIDFIDKGGKQAVICSVNNMSKAILGKTGTKILPDA